jgi:FkbM family methyltransferase
MYSIKKFYKAKSFIKETFIGIKIWGLRKTIKACIFNFLFLLTPIPYKQDIVTTRNGIKLYIIPNDRGISRELKLFKIHEPLSTKILIEELINLKKFVKKVTIIDIGSNIGYYGILEAKILGKNGRVICIEPVRRNFEYLLKNFKLNNINNAKAINIALSDRVGLAKITISHGSNWCYISNENNHNEQSEYVRITTGDSILSQFKKIDLIRMDTEGHEYNIVKGCYKIIKKHLPSLLIEVHPRLLGKHKLLELILILKNLGYQIKYFIPRNIDVPFAASDDSIKCANIERLVLNPPSWNFTLYLEHYSKKVKN